MATISGGDKLQAALDKIARNLTKASSVEIGFMDSATYPDGIPVALVAAVNEFGRPSVGQPPRPFFRNAIADNREYWPSDVGAALKATDYDAARALDLVGQEIQEEIVSSIVDFSGVPLSPATIKKKGFEKQLVDTGVMMRSVTHRVK